MAQDQAGHAIVGDPVDAERRIDLGPEIHGQEAVALQPPRGHQDEDAEGRIAEAEAGRRRLGHQPDDRIDLVDIAIDLLEQAHVLGARRQLFPARDARPVQPGAEVIVARHAAPARAHDIDHGEVDDLVVALELEQRAREVVERDRAGMRDAERIERVAQAEQPHGVVGIAALDVEEALLGDLLAGLVVIETVVVRQQRVHPVDGDEILGQRIGRAVMVRHRFGNAGRRMRVEQPKAELGQVVIGRRAVPVAGQADFDRLRRQDRRRPFDGVDLGDQRRRRSAGPSGRCARHPNCRIAP